MEPMERVRVRARTRMCVCTYVYATLDHVSTSLCACTGTLRGPRVDTRRGVWCTETRARARASARMCAHCATRSLSQRMSARHQCPRLCVCTYVCTYASVCRRAYVCVRVRVYARRACRRRCALQTRVKSRGGREFLCASRVLSPFVSVRSARQPPRSPLRHSTPSCSRPSPSRLLSSSSPSRPAYQPWGRFESGSRWMREGRVERARGAVREGRQREPRRGGRRQGGGDAERRREGEAVCARGARKRGTKIRRWPMGGSP